MSTDTSCWNCGYAQVECTKKREAGGEPCCGDCDHRTEAEIDELVPPSATGLLPQAVLKVRIQDGSEAYVRGVENLDDHELFRLVHIDKETFVQCRSVLDGEPILVNLRHVLAFKEGEV